jgi:hypothetical protein
MPYIPIFVMNGQPFEHIEWASSSPVSSSSDSEEGGHAASALADIAKKERELLDATALKNRTP